MNVKKNNPFNPDLDKKNSFHITTGKAASPEVDDSLLTINETGYNQKMKFLEECSENVGRFEKRIKRNKIMNFASQSMSRVQKSPNSDKTLVIKIKRDVFGRLLAIAVEKK